MKSALAEPYLTIRTTDDADRYLDLVKQSAARAHAWMRDHAGDPMDLLRAMKFEAVGFHPVEDRPLNIIEQLNQTWTYAVAFAAARQLLTFHPDVDGFRVAPGAHMSLPLDIMSIREGLVGAETFAVTHPGSNQKLVKDLAKMAARSEAFRYVFFSAPSHPGLKRLTALEKAGVQVWSVLV